MLLGIFATGLWLGFSIAVGEFALQMGRSRRAWIAISLLISPLIAMTLLFLMGTAGEVCTRCGERIRSKATLCRYCGAAKEPSTTASAHSTS